MRQVIATLRWVSLVWCASCSRPSVEPCVRALPAFFAPFGVVDEPFAVSFHVGLYCRSIDVNALRAQVSIVDSENQPLHQNESELSVFEGALGLSSEMTFTPRTSGWYHFTARFEPSVGTVQGDVLVAEDHRRSQAEFEIPVGPLDSCRHLDVSEYGRPLCLSGEISALERDGGSLQSFGTGEAARMRDVLWVSDSTGNLSRWVESAAGFVRTPDAGVALVLARPLIMTSGDQAFLADAMGSVVGLSVGGGSISVSALGAIGAPQVASLWSDGEIVMTLSGPDEPEGRWLCTSLLDGGAETSTCQKLYGSPLTTGVPHRVNPTAAEQEGLWFERCDDVLCRSAEDPLLPPRRVVLSNRTAERVLNLPLSWSTQRVIAPWDTGAYVVSPDGGTLQLAFRDGGFALRQYPQLPLVSATSRWLALRRGGSLLLYRR